MGEKVSTQRQNITRREGEITELRDKITGRAGKGDDLRGVLDRLAMEQRRLNEEKKQDEEEIGNVRDIKGMREQERSEYFDKLRQVKDKEFKTGEKAG